MPVPVKVVYCGSWPSFAAKFEELKTSLAETHGDAIEVSGEQAEEETGKLEVFLGDDGEAAESKTKEELDDFAANHQSLDDLIKEKIESG